MTLKLYEILLDLKESVSTNLLKKEEGMGTIEIVIIIAVLIGLAFLFRSFAVSFFTELTEGIKENNQINELFTTP
jgi:uncharacterized membrane protein YdfJ with MMPL/SSD domain